MDITSLVVGICRRVQCINYSSVFIEMFTDKTAACLHLRITNGLIDSMSAYLCVAVKCSHS
jgi:hypothetical protein